MPISEIRGQRDLEAFFRLADQRTINNLLRGGMRAGAKIIAEEAALRASNSLVARSVGISSPRARPDGTVSIRIQTSGEGSYLAPWLEYGTAAHAILRTGVLLLTKKRKGLTADDVRSIRSEAHTRSLKIGNRYVGSAVWHPGAKAQAFLRPAFDARIDDAVDAMTTYVAARFNKEGLKQAAMEMEEA